MIKSFIKRLCQSVPLKNDKGEFFYSFIEKKLERYIQLLKTIDSECLKPILSDDLAMHGNQTKQRFLNLMEEIVSECLFILQLSYNGDVFQATIRLQRLLTIRRVTNGRLVDMYANYFKFKVVDDSYYRCVVFNKDEKNVNCNHLPFNLRYKASTGRFNQLGTICFYASSSEELASSSVHVNVNDKRKKWMSEFKPRKKMYFLNLSVPKDEEIDSMNEYDQFAFLITYPFFLLCLTESKVNDGQFVEEYLFSQLFIYLLCQSNGGKLSFYRGICYTPMGKIKGNNIVVPIKYEEGLEPPKEGYSKYISDMFEEVKEPYLVD